MSDMEGEMRENWGDYNGKRNSRHVFTGHQLRGLEENFVKYDGYLAGDTTLSLAEELDLSVQRVKTWFQNRRARFRNGETKFSFFSTTDFNPVLLKKTDHFFQTDTNMFANRHSTEASLMSSTASNSKELDMPSISSYDISQSMVSNAVTNLASVISNTNSTRIDGSEVSRIFSDTPLEPIMSDTASDLTPLISRTTSYQYNILSVTPTISSDPRFIPWLPLIAPHHAPTVPDTELIVPDTEPIVPDTEPIVTDTEPMVPDTEPIVPDTEPIVPNTEPIVPSTKSGQEHRCETSLVSTSYNSRVKMLTDSNQAPVMSTRFPAQVHESYTRSASSKQAPQFDISTLLLNHHQKCNVLKSSTRHQKPHSPREQDHVKTLKLRTISQKPLENISSSGSGSPEEGQCDFVISQVCSLVGRPSWHSPSGNLDYIHDVIRVTGSDNIMSAVEHPLDLRLRDRDQQCEQSLDNINEEDPVTVSNICNDISTSSRHCTNLPDDVMVMYNSYRDHQEVGSCNDNDNDGNYDETCRHRNRLSD